MTAHSLSAVGSLGFFLHISRLLVLSGILASIFPVVASHPNTLAFCGALLDLLISLAGEQIWLFGGE